MIQYLPRETFVLRSYSLVGDWRPTRLPNRYQLLYIFKNIKTTIKPSNDDGVLKQHNRRYNIIATCADINIKIG